MREQLTLEQHEIIEKTLGFPGRMISGSKSGYVKLHPKNLAVFNANVIIAGFGKVWYGDLDLTKDEKLIRNLSEAFDFRTVYVLYEMDGRFENEENPQIEKAVYFTNAVTGSLGASISKYFHRSEKTGKIQLVEQKKKNV